MPPSVPSQPLPYAIHLVCPPGNRNEMMGDAIALNEQLSRHFNRARRAVLPTHHVSATDPTYLPRCLQNELQPHDSQPDIWVFPASPWVECLSGERRLTEDQQRRVCEVMAPYHGPRSITYFLYFEEHLPWMDEVPNGVFAEMGFGPGKHLADVLERLPVQEQAAQLAADVATVSPAPTTRPRSRL